MFFFEIELATRLQMLAKLDFFLPAFHSYGCMQLNECLP